MKVGPRSGRFLGCAKEKPVAVKARSGIEGRQMRYSVTRNRRPQAYWLSVFAIASTVYPVEVSGDPTAVDPLVAVADQTIASFRIR